jgi:hypothetical protein
VGEVQIRIIYIPVDICECFTFGTTLLAENAMNINGGARNSVYDKNTHLNNHFKYHVAFGKTKQKKKKNTEI